ncbi:MAG: hypothetical protein ABS56_08505 [Lautropia sp. SCN 69-89]|nr:MAG: hypothetical protein ABS56_08505 [Lautropia sp. SCN 69-89]
MHVVAGLGDPARRGDAVPGARVAQRRCGAVAPVWSRAVAARSLVVTAERRIAGEDCRGADRCGQLARGAARIDHHELAVPADGLQLLIGLHQHALGRQRRIGPRPVEAGDEHPRKQAPRVHALQLAPGVVEHRAGKLAGILDDGGFGGVVHTEIPRGDPLSGSIRGSVIGVPGSTRPDGRPPAGSRR